SSCLVFASVIVIMVILLAELRPCVFCLFCLHLLFSYLRLELKMAYILCQIAMKSLSKHTNVTVCFLYLYRKKRQAENSLLISTQRRREKSYHCDYRFLCRDFQ